MKTWFWVSRNDTDGGDINIHVRAEKPKRDKAFPESWYLYYETGSYSEGDIEVCRKYFEKFTGIKLKPGECKKVQISAEILS
ncbi:MAG: hypothetical protein J3T61_12995 [Candidatus Brocadiales bacterium]|nr:hypothetical protein [Candidatus Bathyanammoxibius sp.]